MVTGEVGVTRPSRIARKVTYAVISLVIEAGYQAWKAFFSASTAPEPASTTMYAPISARAAAGAKSPVNAATTNAAIRTTGVIVGSLPSWTRDGGVDGTRGPYTVS
jgi:hypothetical protein